MKTEYQINNSVESGKNRKLFKYFTPKLTADFYFSFTPKYLIPIYKLYILYILGQNSINTLQSKVKKKLKIFTNYLEVTMENFRI